MTRACSAPTAYDQEVPVPLAPPCTASLTEQYTEYFALVVDDTVTPNPLNGYNAGDRPTGA